MTNEEEGGRRHRRGTSKRGENHTRMDSDGSCGGFLQDASQGPDHSCTMWWVFLRALVVRKATFLREGRSERAEP